MRFNLFGRVTAEIPKKYKFKFSPKKDITPYELSHMLSKIMFLNTVTCVTEDKLQEFNNSIIRRHFIEDA